ncbi:TetR family transcriptional regulator [Caulobacter sp. D4A]|uniref:TetR/AcrR family transcriptional regulator n=1 Tax=unclassified Caulobacter TaxID=2648921 RepID=UPI000D7352BA|nr:MULTISPECIES: TetR/AcrR family transcriptional regulator [unclassified Caulobacter]PXA91869.1 TetR family transcriptional regulator [Caulobacter sp. D5]PXA94687.1 TetR family transcriptional regulator [Caulobacter sp. D4A]
MTLASPEAARPYHHGDLSRALVEAARRILETDGPAALSLRAVAREAGVSPAAPYHHFKDKGQLLDAVAHEGWVALDEALMKARHDSESDRQRMTNLGVAYVTFARDNPALYRVMYDCSRDKDALPDQMKEEGAYCQVRNTIAHQAGPGVSEIDLELATIAAWCAGHGLAEMSGFKQFAGLKAMLGGEEAFLKAVFDHLGMFAKFDRG